MHTTLKSEPAIEAFAKSSSLIHIATIAAMMTVNMQNRMVIVDPNLCAIAAVALGT